MSDMSVRLMSDMSDEQPDLSFWLTKAEAAQALGVAEKTIERLKIRGEIHQATRKRPGQASVAVFHPEDVNRIKGEQAAAARPGSFVMPSGSETNRPQQTTMMDEFFERLRDAVAPKALPAPTGESTRSTITVPITEKLYLTLREASELSGLPVGYIKAAMKDNRLHGIKTGAGWRIRREDLAKATFG